MRRVLPFLLVSIAACSEHRHHERGTAEEFFTIRLSEHSGPAAAALHASVEIASRIAERRESVGAGCVIERGSTAAWKTILWRGTITVAGASLPSGSITLGPEATVAQPFRLEPFQGFADGEELRVRVSADGIGDATIGALAPREVRLTRPAPMPGSAPAPAGAPSDGGAAHDASAPDAGLLDAGAADASGVDASPSASIALDLEPSQDLLVEWQDTGAARVQIVLSAEAEGGRYVTGFCNVLAAARRFSVPRAIVKAVDDEGVLDAALELFTIAETDALRGERQISLLVGAHGGGVPLRTTHGGARVPASPTVRPQGIGPSL
jgi:hypothetical protein